MSILSATLNALRIAAARIARCRSGAAAIEFALLTPVLAGMMLSVVDVSRIVYSRSDMHESLRGGAQYFMAGGTDLDAARLLVEQSWSSADETSSVDIVRYCQCGDTETTCGALCPDDTVPDIYRELVARMLLSGVFGHYEVIANETVRTR